MAEYLVIRLPADAGEHAEWIAVDDNGTRIGAPGTGPLSDAASQAGARTVVVLVPAAPVLTTAVDLPIKSLSKLQAALPFALEEFLAEDVDQLHFAAGTRQDSGMVPVAVVSHEQMQRWQDLLTEAGLKASRIVPENHGVAAIPGTWSLLIDGDQIMINDGAHQEFVMQGLKPADALAVAGVLGSDDASENGAKSDTSDDDDRKGDTATHLVVYCQRDDEAQYRHDWNALRHELDSVDIHLLPDGALPRLAVTVAAGRGVNLLQGKYGSKTSIGGAFRPWRHAAVLLLALGATALLAKGVDTWRLNQEETALKAQFAEVYQQIRPGDTRDIVDPTAIVRSIRNELAGPTAVQVFLPSMLQLGTALRDSAADIEAISYRAGVIDVRLSAPDVATLDAIQKTISASGRFTAAIQSTDQVGEKVSSRIQIREAGV